MWRFIMIRGLVLSLFPGADLLGRGFELAGYCVVRGPDLLFGQKVEDFHPLPDVFAGRRGAVPIGAVSPWRSCAIAPHAAVTDTVNETPRSGGLSN